jgi:hypothetical protein
MAARILVALVALATAVPAWAEGATAVPEGSHATLFALGVLGVIVGRRASIDAQRRARAKERDAD